MGTPHVTEILPPWRAARELRTARHGGRPTQRDLVVASLLADGGRRDVYPPRREFGGSVDSLA